MKNPRLVLVSSLMVFLTLGFVYIRLSKEEPKPQTSLPSEQTSAKPPLKAIPPKPTPAAVLAPPPLKKGNRSFYGNLPTGLKNIDDLRLVNKPSTQWKKKLEVNLRRLGGERLKTLQLSPQESYIISEGDHGRLVERVIVKLESKDGEYTSFFAEVDSESGHVLKTWGVAIPEKKRHQH